MWCRPFFVHVQYVSVLFALDHFIDKAICFLEKGKTPPGHCALSMILLILGSNNKCDIHVRWKVCQCKPTLRASDSRILGEASDTGTRASPSSSCQVDLRIFLLTKITEKSNDVHTGCVQEIHRAVVSREKLVSGALTSPCILIKRNLQ